MTKREIGTWCGWIVYMNDSAWALMNDAALDALCDDLDASSAADVPDIADDHTPRGTGDLNPKVWAEKEIF